MAIFKMSRENISAAEMTAYWRSQYPQLSGDSLSVTLATPEGIEKAHEFESKYQYPLVGRKVSVRAGWFLREATDRLLQGRNDSCISLGSGFSLLTYYIALATDAEFPHLKFFDVDLSDIIQQRKERIEKLSAGTIDFAVAKKIQAVVINLELACEQGIKFDSLFPTCKHPLFIIEGILYFLSKKCVQWIYDGIMAYQNAAVVFDYWPENGSEQSKCFRRVLTSIKDFIPEKVQGLLSQNELNVLCRSQVLKDLRIQDVEKNFSEECGENPQLIDQDCFIPVKLVVAVNYDSPLE